MATSEQLGTPTLAEAQAEERELSAERELLRITLASVSDGVIGTDAEGRIVFLNAVAEALTGFPRADAIGQLLGTVFRLIDESTRAPLENPGLRALQEGRSVELTRNAILVARDGVERPIDDSATPVRDDAGATVGAVLVFRDLTRRKEAETAQARLAAIVQSSDDAILSKTLDGVIRSWNLGAERVFGYSASEAVGKHITLLIPADRLEEENDILSRLKRGERVDHFETVRVAKDGRQLDISLSISPIKDHDGRVVGASKIARDISEKKRLERELAQRAAELADADRRKDEFIALLAHELRNPLAPIRAGLQLMKLAAADESVVARARATMDRQLSHMVRLIDDLLDVSRMGQNKLHLQKTRVLLSEIVSHTIEAVGPTIEAAGHRLQVSMPSATVAIDADLTRLAQVFGNLLTNSAKFTERGGRIWFTAELEDDEVVVSVRDSGAGIPAEALPRVFDMFAQGDRTLERVSGGLGIGLALVKGLVENHGGSVRAESPGAGQGSTFTVRLPLLRETARPPAVAAAQSSRAGQRARLKVVVADDSVDGVEAMADLLEALGNEVHMARDGVEAVELVEKVRPELVLMDIGMPRLNGLEATRRIRALPGGDAVTIIALTGWGQEADRQRSQAAGCDGHLVKPIDTQLLEKMLDDLLLRPPPASG